jgi:hypothetical protein
MRCGVMPCGDVARNAVEIRSIGSEWELRHPAERASR